MSEQIVEEIALQEGDLMELGENPEGVNSETEAGRYLYVISKKEEELEQLEEKKAEAVEYWDNRIAQVERTIDFLEGQVEAFVSATGDNSISPPEGNAFFRTRQKVQWPEDDEVLKDFSEDRGIELNKKVQVKPDKREIKSYIEETGDVPPQTDIVEVTDFIVNTE